MRTLGRLRRTGIGGAFGIDVDTDPGDPDRYVLNLYQGGIGLPDESYYSDAGHADVLRAYTEFLPGILELAAGSGTAGLAEAVVDLETALAAGHWDRVRSRDSSQTYNPKDRAGLDELLPEHLWDAWLDGLGADPSVLERVVVRQPDYFTALAALLTADRLPAWKAWLTWQIVRSAGPARPGRTGGEELRLLRAHPVRDPGAARAVEAGGRRSSRWPPAKRSAGCTSSGTSRPAAKQRMDELVANLLEAYRAEHQQAAWMSEQTKARALDKLDAFTPKIGYPERWRDYRALSRHAGRPRRQCRAGPPRSSWTGELAKIGSPVDRDEWFMSPQTVNAYYNPGMNEIVFPAAILQPPFFDPGGGRRGELRRHRRRHRPRDRPRLRRPGLQVRRARARCTTGGPRRTGPRSTQLTGRLIDQYARAGTAAARPATTVNGALTVGENIGDLGGLGIAYQAWRISLGGAGAAGHRRADRCAAVLPVLGDGVAD